MSFSQPTNGSVVTSIIFDKKINAPITEISKPCTSTKKAGSKIITGKVGIENAKAGNE
tara:strand:+ start:490 stop:663 length:174 start_codon:yes stop_codon:yes gene_type:complete